MRKVICDTELKARIAAHEKWLKGLAPDDCRLFLKDIDIDGKLLLNSNLNQAILKDVCFNKSKIRKCSFKGAIIKNCSFVKSNIWSTSFKKSKISKTNFTDADIDTNSFDCAEIRECDFTNSVWNECSFTQSNFSGSKGLISSIDYLEKNFKKTEQGYITYKKFGQFYDTPNYWDIREGSILNEVINSNRFEDCGAGINVSTLNWLDEHFLFAATLYGFSAKEKTGIWEVLIPFEWLSGVCVPYNTDGKIRCERVKLIKELTVEELDKELENEQNRRN